MDISQILKQTGVALEAKAYSQLGAAIETGAKGAISSIFGTTASSGGINQNVNPVTANSSPIAGVWDTTSYAAALASGNGGFDAKNNFMFRVSFAFDPDVAAEAASLGIDVTNVLSRNLTYVVKSIDMPKYQFDYMEFNYYNFRTKMLKSISHTPISCRLYDDVGNTAINFFRIYLELLAPVHRTSWTAGAGLEDNGFAFNASPVDGLNSAQRAVLGTAGNSKNILRSMEIEQFYLDRSDQTLSGRNIRRAIRMNAFTFVNPRIDSFEIDSHDYESGDSPHTITCSFDYDALHISPGLYGEDAETAGSGYMESHDILSDYEIDGKPTQPINAAGNGGVSTNPYVSIIANQAGRAVQSALGNALYHSKVGQIAGGALTGTISNITSTLGTNASRSLSNLGQSIVSGIFKPSAPAVSDNATGGNFLSKLFSGG